MEDKLPQEIGNDLDIFLIIAPPFIVKMPHLGVAYLLTFLKSNGIKAGLYDLNLKFYNCAPAQIKFYWQIDCLNSFFVTEVSKQILFNFKSEIDSLVDDIIKAGVKVIGFSVNMVSIFIANEIAKLIKSKDKRRIVLFGGAGAFFKSPRDLMEFCYADILVIGEGEKTTLNILNLIKRGRKIKNGPGVLLGKYYKHKEIFNPKPIEDLGSIPFPRYSEFNFHAYNPGEDYKPLPLILSRGCIGRCTYCIDCIMWPGFRYRLPENVFAEIKYHIEVNRISAFEFNDLTCNGNLRQLSELCNLIIGAGLKFNWVSYAIVRADMDELLFLKLKQSGCHTLIYGLESGSDNVLRRMRKIYTVQDAERIIRLTAQAGICTNINIIAGFPGETEGDFHQTMDFILRNRDYINAVTNVSACTLFPESEIGRLRNKYGVIWQEGQDPMLFCDTNGVGRNERIKRVEQMSRFLEDLKINKTIINKPTLNPVVAAYQVQ